MTHVNTKSIFARQYPKYLSCIYDCSMDLNLKHERLAWARKAAGFDSAAEFARLCGVPVPTYTSNENGTRGFGNERAEVYARKAGVRFDWLVRGEGQPLKISADSLVEAPVLSSVSAGGLDFASSDKTESSTIPIQYHHSNIAFIPVEGESMNKMAEPNDLILVDFSDKNLIDGKFYVFGYENEFSFKKYRSNPDRFEPYSTFEFDTIFPKDGFIIVGRVTRVIKTLN